MKIKNSISKRAIRGENAPTCAGKSEFVISLSVITRHLISAAFLLWSNNLAGKKRLKYFRQPCQISAFARILARQRVDWWSAMERRNGREKYYFVQDRMSLSSLHQSKNIKYPIVSIESAILWNIISKQGGIQISP